MASRQYPLAFWATTLLVALTSQSSVAFTINFPPPDSYNPFVHYDEEGYEGDAYLVGPESIERGGTDELMRLLDDFSRRRGGRWEFERAEDDLKGRFDLQSYYACGPGIECGKEINDPYIDGVGAFLDLRYYPVLGTADPIPDPTRLTDKVQWIQRVKSNHSLDPDEHGRIEDVLDIDSRQSTPYYTTAGNRLSIGIPPIPYRFFVDRSYRNDPKNNHTWNAFLYLVEETTVPGSQKRTVKIYNGIKWGWRNVTCSKKFYKSFSDSLGAGEQDNFHLDKLTPGANFLAWINNDLPSNSCNPNTYLSAYSDDGSFYSSDNDSSFLGDGFASALTGTIIASDGTLNLSVGAVGGRGEDRGNYELYVDVSDNPSPPQPPVSVGGSGGGGFGNEGRTQQNPILPKAVEQGWQVFRNVPSCRWYDPPTSYGFEFQSLEDTLFTEILDFPVGDDNLFTVLIGDTILGEFGPGQSVDFVSLFGSGVSNFKITGIDSLFGDTEETAFPIQLAFNNRVGSFKMRPLSETPNPQSVPESSSFIGFLALGAWSAWSVSSLNKRK